MTMVLAIDPGPEKSAWVVWNGKCIRAHSISANATLSSRASLFHLVHSPYDTVIEMIEGRGMRVGASVFETCVWIGRFMERFTTTERIYRRTVKLHICGSSRAKDADIRQALIDRFGAPGRKSAPGVTYGLAKDEWQAFALAVTWMDTQL